MIESHMNWNTARPKFEDVEGKTVLVQHKHNQGWQFILGVDDRIYRQWFDGGFISCAILSTDDSVCEWNYDTEAKLYYPSCTEKGDGTFEFKVTLDCYKFCPHCGRPIKVITEPEVKTLFGISPEIEMVDSYSYQLTWSNLNKHQQIIVTMPTKQMLIDLWNDGYFATKMKGE